MELKINEESFVHITTELDLTFQSSYSREDLINKLSNCSNCETTILNRIINHIFVSSNSEKSVSFQDFKQWFFDEENVDMVKNFLQIFISTSQSTEEKASILFKFTTDQLFTSFNADDPNNKQLASTDFHNGYESLYALVFNDNSVINEEEFVMLFDLMKAEDSDTSVTLDSVLSCLILFCKDSSKIKIKAIFNIFDKNNSDSLDFIEFKYFLSYVFKVMFKLRVLENNNDYLHLEDIVQATAEEVFDYFKINLHTQSLTFKQFKTWFQTSTFSTSLLNLSNDNSSSEVNFDLLKTKQINLETVIRDLNFISDEKGHIAFNDFRTLLSKVLVTDGDGVESEVDRLSLYLYNFHKGLFTNLSAVFYAMSTCWKEDKEINIIFKVISKQKELMTFNDLKEFNYNLGLTLKALNPIESTKISHLTQDQLSQITAEECFNSLDKVVNVDDCEYQSLCLTEEEFKVWYLSVYHQEKTKDKLLWQYYASLFSLETLTRLSNLQEHYLCEVMTLLKQHEESDGTILCSTFVKVLSALALQDKSYTCKSRLRTVLRVLSKILDLKHNSHLEVLHIAAALSLICKTKAKDKLESVFSIFKFEDQENNIGFNDLKQYLTIVFLFLYEVDSSLRKSLKQEEQEGEGVTIQCLANKAAKSIFRKAHIDKDGKFPIKDLKQWFIDSFKQKNNNEVSNCGVSVCSVKVHTFKDLFQFLNLYSTRIKHFVNLLQSKGEVQLTLETLYKKVKSLKGKQKLNKKKELKLRLFVKQLFSFFSKDMDRDREEEEEEEQTVSVVDILSCLTIFSPESEYVKSRSLFYFRQKEELDLNEVENIFYAVFCSHYYFNIMKNIELKELRALSRNTASKLFQYYQKETVTCEEYYKWTTATDQRHGDNDKHKKILKAVDFKLGEVAKQLQGYDKLRKEKFMKIMKRYVKVKSRKVVNDVDQVNRSLAQVEPLFDLVSKGSDKVSSKDLITGLSVISKDSVEVKQQLIFAHYQLNKSDLKTYFKIIFKVYLFYKTRLPNHKGNKHSVKSLVNSALKSLFREKETISKDDFIAWYRGNDDLKHNHCELARQASIKENIERELAELSFNETLSLFSLQKSTFQQIIKAMKTNAVVLNEVKVFDLSRFTKALKSLNKKQKCDILLIKAINKIFHHIHRHFNGIEAENVKYKVVEFQQVLGCFCYQVRNKLSVSDYEDILKRYTEDKVLITSHEVCTFLKSFLLTAETSFGDLNDLKVEVSLEISEFSKRMHRLKLS